MNVSQAATSSQSRVLRPFLSKLVLALLPVGILLGIVPGIVLAQDEDTEFAGMEEIIVTSQRREQNLQDVPIAISAFTSVAIEKAMFSDVFGPTRPDIGVISISLTVAATCSSLGAAGPRNSNART